MYFTWVGASSPYDRKNGGGPAICTWLAGARILPPLVSHVCRAIAIAVKDSLGQIKDLQVR